MSEKIYCGKAKKSQYSHKINICLSDIPDEFITTSDKNGKKYARLELKESRQPDDRGNTHYLIVDTWKPDGQQAPNAPHGDAFAGGRDDLPF